MAVVTRTATLMVDQPKTLHSGVQAVFAKFITGGTPLSISGVAVLSKLPHGAKVTDLRGVITGTGGPATIGSIGAGSTTGVLALSITEGHVVNLNRATGLGYEVSVSDGAAERFEWVKLWNASVAFTGTLALVIEYVLDDQVL